ncbi:MAG: ATP-binding protein [Acidobacteriaceae bacterium]|jgi:signal transduction histidine kinase
MTAFPTLFFGLLIACIGLLGMLSLRLAAKSRKEQRAIEELSSALKHSRDYAELQKDKLALRSDLDTLKDEFISTVSHELRTPLTSIRGALGLLSAGLMGNVDPRAQNLLRIASSNTERLIRLINDILDLERMESGRAPLNLRRCSIFDLAREAMDSMTGMAAAAEVRLELTSHAARDAIYFDADSDRILQVLTNLLSNAIKFSPTDSVVSVEIDAHADSLLLKVVDHGRGIPADKLEPIFDRFQQVEASDASKKGGTGLGLAICRSIVQQHGGAIWAEQNEDAPGTTLWVQFTRAARASDLAAPSQAAVAVQRGEGALAVREGAAGVGVAAARRAS